ncbi:MAG TPA: M28 family peptidase [Deferrisomatales bacterium]|nr:M28 family peptidase [Deferrisomatales bacterium]
MADSTLSQLQADVAALAVPGGRPVGSAGHRRAQGYLVERIRSLGLQPVLGGSFELPYEGRSPAGRGVPFTNLAGRLPGRTPGLAPILLVAHYDTCGPTPGADDNAAALAILLAVVEPLRRAGLERDVWFAFPDAEEPPHCLGPDMGSTRLCTEQLPPGREVWCGIVFDLCGHDVPVPGCADLLVVAGVETSPVLARVVQDQGPAPAPGVRVVPTLTRYIGDRSDYHVLRTRQRPYLFLSCGEWAHYHGLGDTSEKLNYGKMAGIARYVAALVRGLDGNGDAGADPGAGLAWGLDGFDTTALELAFLKQALGPLAAGVRDREGIDALALRLRAAMYGCG